MARHRVKARAHGRGPAPEECEDKSAHTPAAALLAVAEGATLLALGRLTNGLLLWRTRQGFEASRRSSSLATRAEDSPSTSDWIRRPGLSS